MDIPSDESNLVRWYEVSRSAEMVNVSPDVRYVPVVMLQESRRWPTVRGTSGSCPVTVFQIRRKYKMVTRNAISGIIREYVHLLVLCSAEKFGERGQRVPAKIIWNGYYLWMVPYYLFAYQTNLLSKEKGYQSKKYHEMDITCDLFPARSFMGPIS